MVDELPTFHGSENGRVLIDRCSEFEILEPDDPEWSSDPSSCNQRFSRDVFVFSQDKDLFIAHSATRHSWPLPDSDLDSLEPVKIDKDHVFPSFDPGYFTLAPDPLPDERDVLRVSASRSMEKLFKKERRVRDYQRTRKAYSKASAAL